MMRTIRNLCADEDFQFHVGLIIGFTVVMMGATLGALDALAH